MSKDAKEVSRSKALATKIVYAAFQILKEAGGQLPGREVIQQIPKRIVLDEWAKALYEKTGYIRWQSILHFYTIDCIKAGFLIKQKGTWVLTKEGEAAIELGERALLEVAQKAYREWHTKIQPMIIDSNAIDSTSTEIGKSPFGVTLEQIELQTNEAFKLYINRLNAYEFQNLVAALLRGMGYYTPFVAQRGKDGGIDIIAYRDPLGTISPRIKVQVKHRPNEPSSADVIRQLMGLLQKDSDVGIFVSSGGFTSDARLTARNSHAHVELIDFDKFINLWQEFYTKLNDEDKTLLPLRSIYLLAPEE